MSTRARTPKPFLSVLMMSIGAYSLFWNLLAVAHQPGLPRARAGAAAVAHLWF